jgi:hypothetical protein
MRRRTGSSVAVGGGEVAAVAMVTKRLQSSDSEAWSRGGENREIDY